MPLIALRGATTIDSDDAALLADATRELLHTLLSRNAIDASRVVSAVFTTTSDLTSAYPAEAARAMGWDGVPMLCAVDPPVRGALPRCIRVLLHVEVPGGAPAARHAFLRDAVSLRPDLDDDEA